MIEIRGNTRTVMGYCRYVELFEADDPSATKKWSTVMLNFLLNLEIKRPDFRQMRLKRLVVHLVGLLKLLNADQIEDYLLQYRKRWLSEVK